MIRRKKLNVMARFHHRVVDNLMTGLERVFGTEAVFTYTWQMDEDVRFLARRL